MKGYSAHTTHTKGLAKWGVLLLGGLFACSISSVASGKDYTLLLNPIDPADKVIRIFTPLAQYMGKATGDTISPVCENNFLANWQRLLRTPPPDFTIQAAHISSYLIERKGFQPVARVDGLLSFSIVTSGDELVFDRNDLIGKRVATLVAPSLGTILVNRQFNNPIRLPVFSSADNTEAAVAMLKAGKVKAAIIPTPMVGNFDNLNVVESTSQYPLITVIAAPGIAADKVAAIRKALLAAKDTAAGRSVLEAINIPTGFVEFKPEDVKGLHSLLRGTWGY